MGIQHSGDTPCEISRNAIYEDEGESRMDQTHIQIHVDPAEAIVGGADQTLKFNENG